MSLCDVKVGDTVVIVDVNRAHRKARVARIGRKYIYIVGAPDCGYDIDTGRRNDRWGHTHMITVDAHELQMAAKESERRLSMFGVDISRGMPPARIVEIREALEPLFHRWGAVL